MKKDTSIWLVTSAHLKRGLWFQEEQDFKVGMNYVASLAAISPVSILAFILMSNHVHFVIMGTKNDSKEFVVELKRRYSNYYQRKYHTGKLLKHNDIDTREAPLADEAAERAIAYVIMNCVAANICSHPTQYPWGSGNVYYNVVAPVGIRLDSVSERKRMRLLHSKTALPGNWLLSESGYVLPSSYVSGEFVERLFRYPKRMDYFLRTSSKARKRLEAGQESQPSFKDQTIVRIIPELCLALFNKTSFKELSEEQQTEFLRQLQFRFSSNVHQLARITELSYDETARKLDAQ